MLFAPSEVRRCTITSGVSVGAVTLSNKPSVNRAVLIRPQRPCSASDVRGRRAATDAGSVLDKSRKLLISIPLIGLFWMLRRSGCPFTRTTHETSARPIHGAARAARHERVRPGSVHEAARRQMTQAGVAPGLIAGGGQPEREHALHGALAQARQRVVAARGTALAPLRLEGAHCGRQRGAAIEWAAVMRPRPPAPNRSRGVPIPGRASGRPISRSGLREHVNEVGPDVIEQPLIMSDQHHGAPGVRRLFTPVETTLRASMSRPESVSSRIASFGSRTSICSTSLRFFSPPENPR